MEGIVTRVFASPLCSGFGVTEGQGWLRCSSSELRTLGAYKPEKG